MLKEGMFIQERYEIINKIGSGGMADVYKAKDYKLNRFVAVKVLKKEFREDKAFISKFRVEAQSAAGLAHANIVNVYDVGEDNGINYIVMELVEGITLKDYIEKKGKLAVREATSIAIQVSMGLEAAHNNSIVHRDVKPQNIIISTDGKVKVTDFGIARAASSNTISSNVMGSVHYSSPEQARGGYSDYKSDIYSLGITMYEMLTGHVPFDGDTTVAIAIKHLQEEMQSPRKYVSDLPKSIVQIIYKCTQKSPDRRYANMEELIRDLKESLVNPDGDFVQIAPLNNHAHTVVVSKEELEQIKNGNVSRQDENIENEYARNSHPEDAYQDMYQENGYQRYDGEPYGRYPNDGEPYGRYPNDNYGNGRYPNDGYGNGSYYQEEEDSGVNKKLEKFMTIGSIVIGILIVAIILLFFGSAANLWNLDFLKSGNKNATESVTETKETGEKSDALIEVPDVRGKTKEEAVTVLNQKGLGLKFAGEKESSDYPVGQIMEQSPEAGSNVELNSEIAVYISTGTGAIKIPDVSGKSATDAKQELQDLDIQVDTEYMYDLQIPEGEVIKTQPAAGSMVQKGSNVTIIVSKGAQVVDMDEKIPMPNVIGEQWDEARKILEDKGLYVVIQESYSSDYEEGTIMEQSEQEGTEVNAGTRITLTVSLGKLPDEDTGEDTQANPQGAAYSCKVNLKAPDNYNGEPVKITIEQDGTETTVVDGEAVSFPYKLSWTSNSSSEGTAYIYITNTDGSVTQVRYRHIPFN